MGKFLIGIILFIFTFFFVAGTEAVQADTLVIQDNGAVILLIGTGAVMGETTSPLQPTKSKPKEAKKEEKHITVPLIAPETKSVIKITPPGGEDKKIQITVTTLPKNQATATTVSISKKVDSVVAQDSSGKKVLDIRPAGKNSLTINNENVAVNTSLPLQINTQTHEFNVISQGQTQKINVLPAIAVNSLLNTRTIRNNSGQSKPTVSLTNNNNDVFYQIRAENQVRLLGSLDVKWPIEVEISVQTGRTISRKEPFYSNVLRFLNP